MGNRTKFKISRFEKKTKRGKGVYRVSTLFLPEEISKQFPSGSFTVKRIGDNIIYTHVKTNKIEEL